MPPQLCDEIAEAAEEALGSRLPPQYGKRRMEEILSKLRGGKVRPSYEQIREQCKGQCQPHGFVSQGAPSRPMDYQRQSVWGKRAGADAVSLPHTGPKRKRQKRAPR